MCKTRILPMLLVYCMTVWAQLDEERWIVGCISFIGNTAFKRSALLDRMALKPPGIFSKSEYTFSKALKDAERLAAFYRGRGYLNASVVLGDIERNREKGRVGITFIIREGIQTVVDTIHFRRNRIYPDSVLRKFIPLKSGAPFDSTAFARSRSIMAESLATKGYFFSGVAGDYTLDSSGRWAEVEYTVESGPIVRAGEPEITGLQKVQPVVVRRELVFEPGDTLTSLTIRRSIGRLYRSGLFDLVRIEPIDLSGAAVEEEIVTVPVLVHVREAEMLAFRLGGGYTTYEGWYAGFETTYRNLFALGHRISLFGNISWNNPHLQLTYAYPWFFGVPLSGDALLYIERRELQSYTYLLRGGTVALSGRITDNNAYRVWTQVENIGSTDEPPPTVQFPGLQHRNTVLFGAGLNRDTRTSLFNPGTSLFTYVQGEIAGPWMGWSNHFYKIVYDLRGYYYLQRYRMNAAAALFTGYVDGYGGNGVVPSSELFIAGFEEVRPVRGYDEESLSPVDENGNRRGGKFALVLNPVNLRFPIFGPLYGIAFVDAGYVWRALETFAVEDLQWSAGPGLMLDLPIGPLRIEYGIPIRTPFSFAGRFHFGIGFPF